MAAAPAPVGTAGWASWLAGSPLWPPSAALTLRRSFAAAGEGAGLPLLLGAQSGPSGEVAGAAWPTAPVQSAPFVPGAPSLVLFRSALPHAPEPTPETVVAAVGSLAGSVGRPLPPAVRRTMERAMGADLGLVRVHSGPRVARATAAVGARAMTLGSDVFLPGGAPDTPRSLELPLVAHELAHAAGHRSSGGASADTPWVRLARKESEAEQQASGLESFIAGAWEAPRPGTEPVGLTLARTPAPPTGGGPALAAAPTAAAPPWPPIDAVQRTSDDQAEPAPTGIYAGGLGGSAGAQAGAVARIQRAEGDAPAGAGAGGGGGDDALAERVFKLLQRRLLVERERTGVVGRFGRFV